jgi:hypothetical protein
MIVIHVMNGAPPPGVVGPSLGVRLRVMPAVIATGARQTGKSTLVQKLTPDVFAAPWWRVL